MKNLTRRRFVQTAAASALALSAAGKLSAKTLLDDGQGDGERSRYRLPKGYLLVQGLNTYNYSNYGAISTVAEANTFFDQLAGSPEGKLVNGLEYTTLWYNANDVQAHATIAQVGLARKIDLWQSHVTPSTMPAFGPMPPEYQSSYMKPNGQIVPTTGPIFDILNPEAMDWFLPLYQSVFMEPMKGLISGYFFDEDNLEYVYPYPANNVRYPYWLNATYSPRVLSLWQAYCGEHDVTYNDQLVESFPVHDPAMVANGGGLTAYYPGYNVPAVVQPGQAFVSLPRAEGVWKHWFDFTCELFLKNWIGRLAKLANDVNRNESIWKGVLYFQLHPWGLPYEEIKNPDFRLDSIQYWAAWGRQRGVDLVKLARHPEVDHIVCETYPPVAANLDEFIGEWSRITLEAHKTFGVMLDRDDSEMLNMAEEQKRWALIHKYQPTVITRYPVQRMMTSDPLYNPQVEAYIAQQLLEYRQRED